MESGQPPRDILIVGAGLAGVACAIAISQELGPFVPDLKIRVFERNDFPSTSGGAINLTPVAQRHLASLGVMEELNRMGTHGGADIDSIELLSITSARPVGSIDFTDRAGNDYSGYKGRRVMRVVLLMAMINTAEHAHNIEFIYGKKFTSGGEINDKAASSTRTNWVDPDWRSEYSGMSFVQTTIDAKEIPSPIPFGSSLHLSRHGSLLTTYCDRDREHIFTAAILQFPGETLGHYRLKPGQDWSTRHRIQLSLRRLLKKRFRKCAEPCVKEIIHSDQEWVLYPVYQIRPGGRWCMNRVALLGDAAHAMPPVYSSASYALDDAILFSRVLARYRSEPLNAVFDTYDSLRRNTVDHAFAESTRLWNRIKDRGYIGERLNQWRMSSYLRHITSARRGGCRMRQGSQFHLQKPVKIWYLYNPSYKTKSSRGLRFLVS